MLKVIKNNRLIILVILLVFLPFFLFSQNSPVIKIQTSRTEIPVQSDVYIFNDANMIDSTKTGRDGNGQFKVDIGNFYTVVVKANGYYGKTFFIDTKGIKKDRAKDKFNEVVAELEMIPKNKEYELINIKPSVLFYFDEGLDKFVYQEDSLDEALIRSEEFNLLISFIDSTPIVKEQFVEYTRLCRGYELKLDSAEANLKVLKMETISLNEKINSGNLIKIYLGVGLIVLLALIAILVVRLKRSE